jgi:hypothetical protein
MEALAWWYDCGGAVFGDDRGAAVDFAGIQFISGVDLRGELLAIEQDWGFEWGRRAELCSAWIPRLRSGQAHGGGRPHMIQLLHMRSTGFH